MEVSNMALIPNDSINELRSASELKDVASTALVEIELKSVAAAINSAANTGLLEVPWHKQLSADVSKKLTDKGYKVKPLNDPMVALYIISWEG